MRRYANSVKHPRKISPFRLFMSVLLTACAVLLGLIAWELQADDSPCFTLEQVQRRENINHGETLSDFIANVADDDFESAGYFLPDGTKIIELSDFLPDKVVTPGNVCAYLGQHYDNLTKVHTHPSCDSCFSRADLRAFGACTFATESIVVADNFLFHIRKEIGQVITKEESDAFFEAYDDNYGDYTRSYGLSALDATEYYYKEDTGIIIPVCDEDAWAYAEEFNLSFWIEPKADVVLVQRDYGNAAFDHNAPTKSEFYNGVSDAVDNFVTERPVLTDFQPYVIPEFAQR